MTKISLVWFRQDLRLEDNPALIAAVARGEPIVPVYIWSPDEDGDWPMGAASRWWLHSSLTQLGKQLTGLGSKLIIRNGKALPEILSLIEEAGADAVYWTRRYEPASIERDSLLKAELCQQHLLAESFNGQLLFEPWEVQTKEGRPYQVFTAFWKSCLAKPEPAEPQLAPGELRSPRRWPSSIALRELKLEPAIRWDSGLISNWKPGSVSAVEELRRFLQSAVFDYDASRDRPAEHGTSRLSPHLHFGEISPRTIWHETKRFLGSLPGDQAPVGATTFMKEIGWREFAHHLLFHFPQTVNEPLHREFSRFPWQDDPTDLRAWQRGHTGYPIVDAGMRELWTTGWMHTVCG